jgi:hypothetical protein
MDQVFDEADVGGHGCVTEQDFTLLAYRHGADSRMPSLQRAIPATPTHAAETAAVRAGWQMQPPVVPPPLLQEL